MKKHFPAESEGLGPRVVGNGFALGIVPGVNDASAELVEGFRPTRYELEVLATDYMERLGVIAADWEAFGQTGSYEIRFGPFAWRRLDTICNILGEEEFTQAIAPVKAKWDNVLAKCREQVENPEPCEECGASRSGPLPLSDLLCDRCGLAKVGDEAHTD